MTQEERRIWYALEKATKRSQSIQLILLTIAVLICTAFLLGIIIEI